MPGTRRRSEPARQRQRKPMPRLAAVVSADTSWKTTGVNSNESRTKLAPTATRADTSSSHGNSADSTAAPPTTQKGRAISLAALRVSLPTALSRPISAEAQGRALICPKRSRHGQASKLAASSLNAAVPPTAPMSVRQAWLTPSKTAGDQSAGRSIPTVAYNATAGMTAGAGPTNACPASCTPRVCRPRASGSGGSAFCRSACGLGDGGGRTSAVAASASASAVPAARSAAVGSSVTAMMSATASLASLQEFASTRRKDGFVPAAASCTAPATVPAGLAENCARIRISPFCSSNLTRGERACTRPITSALVAQAGSASTLRLALGTTGSAAASRTPAPIARTSSAAIVVEASGKVAP
jgi:hypothetical protein